MKLDLPPIPAGERTILVAALLAIIDAQQRRTALLEEEVLKLRDEIATLKGQKARPATIPRRLETPPAQGAKRPGSQTRCKKDVFLTERRAEKVMARFRRSCCRGQGSLSFAASSIALSTRRSVTPKPSYAGLVVSDHHSPSSAWTTRSPWQSPGLRIFE